MKLFQFAILSVIFLTSCGPQIITVGLDHFTIDENALKNGTRVRALSFSGGDQSTGKSDTYFHVLVVSLESKDTFNLLTLNVSGLLADDDQMMDFISSQSPMYPAMASTITDKDLASVDEVSFDMEFQSDLDNTYPTVIGILGEVNKTENQE